MRQVEWTESLTGFANDLAYQGLEKNCWKPVYTPRGSVDVATFYTCIFYYTTQ